MGLEAVAYLLHRVSFAVPQGSVVVVAVVLLIDFAPLLGLVLVVEYPELRSQIELVQQT